MLRNCIAYFDDLVTKVLVDLSHDKLRDAAFDIHCSLELTVGSVRIAFDWLDHPTS